MKELVKVPDWSPTKPLPLKMPEAVALARKKLGTVTRDAQHWFVYNITLWHQKGEVHEKWYYGITLCRLAEGADQSDGCHLSGYAQLEVSMNGTVGKLKKLRPRPRYFSTEAPTPPDPPLTSSDFVASLPYQQIHVFSLVGRDADNHSTRLPREKVLQSPIWKPSAPLPLGINDAIGRARKELPRYVLHSTEWRLLSIGIELLPGTSNNWFYSFYFGLPSKDLPGLAGEIVLLVTFDGQVSEVTGWP